MGEKTRILRDSLGEVAVPESALYGAQTQRARENFSIAGRPMPAAFLRALAHIKAAAAQGNEALGLLDHPRAGAIVAAAEEVLAGKHDDQFPVDVYQTGSGTSSNMNMNEVLASIAGHDVHPNDHVNLCQSSNDVVPSALQIAVVKESTDVLLPALDTLIASLRERASSLAAVVKTGRTHLMDAMPLTLEQEFNAWAEQLARARDDIGAGLPALQILPLGGTAVGTGINAHPGFASEVTARLSARLELDFSSAEGFRNLGNVDAALAFSGRLNTLAAALAKVSNDLRWMNSGPDCGLGEIALPALQPGSSIMPGKVNPVIPEAVLMACTQVAGLHSAVTIAGQSGNFQLNVMLPLVADNLLQAVSLLAGSARSLADKAIAGLEVNRDVLEERLARSPVLVTALVPYLGYERCAAIAAAARESGRPILDVAREMSDLSEDTLRAALDPGALTRGGLPQRES